jgi:hypothetical protein
MFGLYVASPQELFIGAGQDVLHITDGGPDFRYLSTDGGNFIAIGGTSAGDVWAATRAGEVYRLSGTTWSPVPSPVLDELFALDVTPSAVHVAGDFNSAAAIQVFPR